MSNDDHATRLFADDDAVRHVGKGLLARTLPRAEWTHEAHLGACLWVVTERLEIDAERDLPEIIRRYNESVGGVNDETQGYHETITQCFIRGVRHYLGRMPVAPTLSELANGLLLAPEGQRDWPLHFFSSEHLFSVDARLRWVEPDLRPLPPLP